MYNKQEILDLYEKYESTTKVAEVVGVCDETVRRVLIKNGIQRTHRHYKKEKQLSNCNTKYCHAQVLMLRCVLHYDHEKLCSITGYPYGSIEYVLSKNGLTHRNTGVSKTEQRRQYDKKRRLWVTSRRRDLSRCIKWQDIYGSFGGKCAICGRKVDPNDVAINNSGRKCLGRKYPTVDHIIPLKFGGTDTFSNVQLACKHCNSKKGIKDMSEVVHYAEEQASSYEFA